MVCLGTPMQERWIGKNAGVLDVPLVFGNGGAIDMWAGDVRRAPLGWRRWGLEWLFRLFQDFTLPRLRRYVRLVVFALLAVAVTLSSTFNLAFEKTELPGLEWETTQPP